jgi:hypothetical protein
VRPAVVDTNVLIVANQQSDHATVDCIKASIDALSQSREKRIVALDNGMLILDEYRRQASLAGQPGVGDACLRHLYDNLYNERVCKLVKITPTGDGTFAEFPSDPRLEGFDRNDRKFVAVALTCSPCAEVFYATDRDWWDYRGALKENGVDIVFLCPSLMQG